MHCDLKADYVCVCVHTRGGRSQTIRTALEFAELDYVRGLCMHALSLYTAARTRVALGLNCKARGNFSHIFSLAAQPGNESELFVARRNVFSLRFCTLLFLYRFSSKPRARTARRD